MDSVSETPVGGAARRSGSWITAAVAVAGLIVIAVVVAATVTSNGKGAGFGPVSRAQDRAVQSDLRNALTAEKTIYTDNQAYSSKIAELRSVEPSLDWGGRLHVVVDKSTCSSHSIKAGTDPAIIDPGIVVNGPDLSFEPPCSGSDVVCLDEQSPSGTTFSLGDVASGAMAGTYYGRQPCPAKATASGIVALDGGWDSEPPMAGAVTIPSLPDGINSVPDPRSSCIVEMEMFHVAIEAYRAIGQQPWPKGDAHTVAKTLATDGLLASPVLSYDSATTPPKANTWYYDPTTHQFTSRCDA